MNKNTHRKFAAHQNNTSDIPEAGIIYIYYTTSVLFLQDFYMYFTTKLHLFFLKNHINNFYFKKMKEAKPFYTFYRSVYRLYLAEHKKAGCSAFA